MVETEIYTIHLTAFIYQPVATPHQPRYAQQLFNFGMIATGNHNFERFADAQPPPLPGNVVNLRIPFLSVKK